MNGKIESFNECNEDLKIKLQLNSVKPNLKGGKEMFRRSEFPTFSGTTFDLNKENGKGIENQADLVKVRVIPATT